MPTAAEASPRHESSASPQDRHSEPFKAKKNPATSLLPSQPTAPAAMAGAPKGNKASAGASGTPTASAAPSEREPGSGRAAASPSEREPGSGRAAASQGSRLGSSARYMFTVPQARSRNLSWSVAAVAEQPAVSPTARSRPVVTIKRMQAVLADGQTRPVSGKDLPLAANTDGDSSTSSIKEKSAFPIERLLKLGLREPFSVQTPDSSKTTGLKTTPKDSASLFSKTASGDSQRTSSSGPSLQSRQEQKSMINLIQHSSMANYQLRPLTKHQVLMEISSRWLAADARAKAKAKARGQAELKTGANTELKESLDQTAGTNTSNAATKSAACPPEVDRSQMVVTEEIHTSTEGKQSTMITVKQDLNGSEEGPNGNRTITLVIAGHRDRQGAEVPKESIVCQETVASLQERRGRMCDIEVDGHYECDQLHENGAIADNCQSKHSGSTGPSLSDSCQSNHELTTCAPSLTSNIGQKQYTEAPTSTHIVENDSTTISQIEHQREDDGNERGNKTDHESKCAETASTNNGENATDPSKGACNNDGKAQGQPRRRRKQHLNVRGTEPIPSPGKTTTAHPSPTPDARDEGLFTNHHKQSLASQPGTTSTTNTPSKGGPKTVRRSRRQAERREDPSHMLAPNAPNPRLPGRPVETRSVAQMLLEARDQMYLDRPPIPPRAPTQQVPDLAAVRSRMAVVGTRAMGQLWSAWGGAVDTTPPSNSQSRRPPRILPKTDVAPMLSSQVTHVRLHAGSGDWKASRTRQEPQPNQNRKSSEQIVRQSWNSTEAVEQEKMLPDVKESDISKSEAIIEIEEGLSPTTAAERLLEALENLDADAEVVRQSSSPPLRSSEGGQLVLSSPDEIEVDGLTPSPPETSSPNSRPCMSSAAENLPPGSWPNLSPTKAARALRTEPTSPLLTMTDHSHQEPVMISASIGSSRETPKSTYAAPSSPYPGRADALTPKSSHKPSRKTGQGLQEAATAETAESRWLSTFLPAPSVFPAERSSTVPSFPYLCMFCSSRFQKPEQHLNHLVQCVAPITGRSWAGMMFT